MHWFWRGLIAIVATVIFAMWYHSEAYWSWLVLGTLSQTIFQIGKALYDPTSGPWPVYMLSIFIYYLPIILVAFMTYALMTRYFGPKVKADSETRCRKCGYILKGIREPICSECGERI